jgi:hypothetical protein
MTTFTWHITNLDRKILDGMVYTVHWTVSATRKATDGDDLTVHSNGSISLSEPDPNDFIPYENLKKDDVLKWVLTALGEKKVESIFSYLENQIDIQQVPVNATGVPW